jgi:hypothetical protein
VAVGEGPGALVGLVELARDAGVAGPVDERLEVPGDAGDVGVGVWSCGGDRGRVRE